MSALFDGSCCHSVRYKGLDSWTLVSSQSFIKWLRQGQGGICNHETDLMWTIILYNDSNLDMIHNKL